MTRYLAGRIAAASGLVLLASGFLLPHFRVLLWALGGTALLASVALDSGLGRRRPSKKTRQRREVLRLDALCFPSGEVIAADNCALKRAVRIAVPTGVFTATARVIREDQARAIEVLTLEAAADSRRYESVEDRSVPVDSGFVLLADSRLAIESQALMRRVEGMLEHVGGDEWFYLGEPEARRAIVFVPGAADGTCGISLEAGDHGVRLIVTCRF